MKQIRAMEDKLGDKLRRRGKLPGLPQKPRSAFFLWVNAEGRDKTKVFAVGCNVFLFILLIEGGKPWLELELQKASERGVQEGW